MRLPNVMVLHNAPTLSPEHPDADSEHDIVETAECMVKIIEDAGLPVRSFSFSDDPLALIQRLSQEPCDVVFNLYEGTATWGNAEAYVTGILEMLRVPFTGSPLQPIMLARSKSLTKQLLIGSGIPTARFIALEGDAPVPENTLGWPVIVKPGREDASVGIDQGSVVTTQAQLEERVAYVRRSYGPSVLFEQFLIGREFHVAVWEQDGVARVLPFSEIFFHEVEGPDALWPIVSFDAKWREDSRDYRATPVVNPAIVENDLARRVSDMAVAAFQMLGCRDYARIDFRIVGETPYVLEVNPNPCISPLAGVAEALASAQIPFAEFVLSLLRFALRRGPHPELADFTPVKLSSPLTESDE